MLRKLCIVTIMMLLFSIFLFSEESKADKQVFKTTADRLNPTEKDYPSGRATDMIVIYTPEFGERTGTNQWGVEAIIVNGIVTKVGGNDSEIPKDGYVISGHGIGADWIREHLKKGAMVTMKGKKIKVQHGTISEIYDVNPLDLTPEGNPEMWENWRKWREENTTNFVETVIKELKAIRNDIEISAAVFPEYESSLTEIMQNWKLWTDNGWFEFVCPMIYSDDKGWVDKTTKNFLKLAGNTPTVPGIAPFMKIPTNDIIEQILILREDGTAGVIMFALHSVNDDLIYALKRGPFKQPARTGVKTEK